MHIRTERADGWTDEYGGAFRRLYPWKGVTVPPWGGAVMKVMPGQQSIPHDHDEEETFIFISGSGTITVDGETSPVASGDVVYLPRFSRHFVDNTSRDEELAFLCVWWGAPEADAKGA
ncbi:cupin domain-containing protein [Labrys sp. KB_33_2]|uniref:cupin domain-containing protein n=1 Tax=Labrys sp. KB_33_2 TaxID=3237479 RepID=UPI003F900CAD